ncbi:MAG: hypothetical protein ABR564_02830 [Candidatus Dormibacteria bacterium]
MSSKPGTVWDESPDGNYPFHALPDNGGCVGNASAIPGFTYTLINGAGSQVAVCGATYARNALDITVTGDGTTLAGGSGFCSTTTTIKYSIVDTGVPNPMFGGTFAACDSVIAPSACALGPPLM